MKTNIFRRLLSLLLVLTCSVSAAIVSCSPFAAAKTAGTASNAEPSKNERTAPVSIDAPDAELREFARQFLQVAGE